MIKFRNVRFANFLSYGNYTTEIWLDYKPTTLLIGESGSGKSAVMDAIAFGLFGRPFRPINKPQLTNLINNADCLVEIEFEIGTNAYKIRRGLKPAIFEIFCNDVMINQDSHTKDYQDHLEKNIIHMNFKTFSQVIVLGVANFTPFMQLKPPDRRALIEDLLDIQIFSTMSALLKDKLAAIKEQITQTATDIGVHQEKVELYQKYLGDLKKDKQRQIDDNKKKIEESSGLIKQNQVEIENIQKQIAILQEKISDERKVVDKLSTYMTYQKEIENNLRRLRKDLKFYEENDSCPTCTRDFDLAYKESVLTDKKKRAADFELGLKKIEAEVSKMEIRHEEILGVKKGIQKYKDDITSGDISISSMKKYIGMIENENENIIKNQKDVSEEEKKLDEMNSNLAKLTLQREDLARNKLVHETATSILKDGGIKSKIIKQYLPIINKLVNRFLSAMNFYMTFSIDENFHEIIRSRGRDEMTYSCLSEGERQRMDIAILLTWRTVATMKNSIRTNLLFVDELLDSSLDPLATENIIEMINNEPILKKMNVFVISHKTNMIDKFSEHIKFEKKKNFSRVVP